MKIIVAVDARRRALGTAPLESVTFGVIDEDLEEPIFDDFSPDSEHGIVCYIRTGHQRQQPSALLTTVYTGM